MLPSSILNFSVLLTITGPFITITIILILIIKYPIIQVNQPFFSLIDLSRSPKSYVPSQVLLYLNALILSKPSSSLTGQQSSPEDFVRNLAFLVIRLYNK